MSKRKLIRRAGGLTAAGLVGLAAVAGPSGAAPPVTAKGPSTSIDPYVVPVADDVLIQSLLTVNDPASGATNGYEMVGIPDGLGVIPRTDGRFQVIMNHELNGTAGITRDHGQTGAFNSTWTIDPATQRVWWGKDVSRKILYYDYSIQQYTTGVPSGEASALSRFCSGWTAQPGVFYNASTGNGTMVPVHLAGEEIGSEGRAFATLMSGTVAQLPRLGRFSFENAVGARNATDTTTVALTDDSGAGRVGIYAGTKGTGGSVVSNAGLANGTLFNVQVDSGAVQTDAAYRAAHNKGDVLPMSLVEVDWRNSGAAQKAEAEGKGAMQFNRIEDSAWDPNNPNDLYFLTTDGGEGSGGGGGGGLWRLRFTDVENPALGGTIELLLDGTESITLNKPDNMDIDTHGNLMIQEDPGNDPVLARIVAYRLSDGAVGTVAQFDPNRFDPVTAGGSLFTQDEESSGILDMETYLGAGWFIFDAQVHTSAGLPAGTGPGTVQELVENGQLLTLHVGDWTSVYGS